MLPLIRTLFDIALMRKGPEDIPRSRVIILMTLLLWIFSSLAALSLIEQIDETDFFLGFFNATIGILCYTALVVTSGRSERLMQTISAIIGCGALISLAFVVVYAVFLPLLGKTPTAVVASLLLLWSVPVEGHIIARAIDRHWYIGLLFAIAVFVLQYVVQLVLTSAP